MKYTVYIKYSDMKRFSPVDLGKGILVKNLIHATWIEDSDYNKRRLQEIAEAEGHGCILQLRAAGKTVFSTH